MTFPHAPTSDPTSTPRHLPTHPRCRWGGVLGAAVAAASLLTVSCIRLAPPVTASTGVPGGDTGEITFADITGDQRADAVVADDDGHLFWFERCADDSC